ncbi:prepilin-type N-terminal cleavage/methylation domain-containing protein, partial [candidate division WOR-3 bacterium]|nr:prepilin-type N-terminal cleavage/methylation domain-containing protein [candidate division WOR-3 bacterium]
MKKIPKYPKSKIPKKTNTTNESRIRNSSGFTLVEILVSITILSIGILAVSQMTVMGLRVNTVVNQRMYARVVMSRVFEDLHNLPSNDAWLFDTDGTNNLNDIDTSNADHYKTITDTTAMYSYLSIWNVADNIPETNIKTVRIHILWGPNNKNRISTDLIKRM